MAYGSPRHNYAIEKEENTKTEETDEITREGHGHDLPASRQNAGPRPATNVSCGCTGGGNWMFMALVGVLLALFILSYLLR